MAVNKGKPQADPVSRSGTRVPGTYEVMDQTSLEAVGPVKLDNRKRLTLPIGDPFGAYHAFRGPEGEILLLPMVEIPARELWLYQNPERLKAVLEGLEESKRGDLTAISFKDDPEAQDE